MEVPKLNTMQPNQSSNVQAHHNYTDVNALSSLKKQARDDQESALRPVAEQFEALFVQQILKESRKVSFDEGWLDGGQGDFYKDWSDKQLSLNLSSKGTLGFADSIVEQLAPNLPKAAQLKQESVHPDPKKPLENAVSPLSTEQAIAFRKLNK